MISCHQGQTVHISWNPEIYCCTWDRYCSPTLLLSTLAKSLLANVPKEVFALQESCLDSELPHICEKQQKWPSAWFAGFQFQHCKLQLLNLIERMQTISLSFVTDFLWINTSFLSEVSLIFLVFISCMDLPFITPPCQKMWKPARRSRQRKFYLSPCNIHDHRVG